MAPMLRYVKFIGKILTVLIIIHIISSYQNHYRAKRRFKSFRIWRKALENENLKYILIWSKEEPDLVVLKKEQEAFIENNCLYTNCYVTKDKNLSDIVFTNFDAIVISSRNLSDALPEKRYQDQVFIFASRESADNYPVCDSKFDNYFNWTWTYKLNSDIVWPYFNVRDLNGKRVAPRFKPNWVNEMSAVSQDYGQSILQLKKRGVAWFVSNCYTRGRRESFFYKLKEALNWYGIKVDVVGACGTHKCPLETDEKCNMILERYYFYLAFENSLSDDYVSEKVLRGLQHNTVPVIFGGANFSRFLPPGSYINARKLGPKKTAEKMASLIVNQTAYLEYFKWHNYYTFNETRQYVCTLCEWLNKGVKKTTKDLSNWWNEANDTCSRRNKRSTIRSRILGVLLGSTCALDEPPHLLSFFKSSGIYSMNMAHRAKRKKIN